MIIGLSVVATGFGCTIFRSTLQPRQFGARSFAAACKAYAEAQEIYHQRDYDGDGVLEYAQTLHGLLETAPGKRDLALVDLTFAMADSTLSKRKPKVGYFFKILTAQGPHARGGKKSYLDAAGNMTGGYALLAYPAKYGRPGVDSFIINQHGLIYSKDLGANTATRAEQMTEFDPDSTWVMQE